MWSPMMSSHHHPLHHNDDQRMSSNKTASQLVGLLNDLFGRWNHHQIPHHRHHHCHRPHHRHHLDHRHHHQVWPNVPDLPVREDLDTRRLLLLRLGMSRAKVLSTSISTSSSSPSPSTSASSSVIDVCHDCDHDHLSILAYCWIRRSRRWISGLPTSGLATWWAIFTNASLRSIIMTIIIIITLRVDHASNCVEMGLSMIKWGKFCIEFLTSSMPFSSNYRFDRAVDPV